MTMAVSPEEAKALGAKQRMKHKADRVALAELLADEQIVVFASDSFAMGVSRLYCTREDWNEHLRPKYLAAGWKKADWHTHWFWNDWIEMSKD